MFSALPTGAAIALGAGSGAFVVLIELFVYKKVSNLRTMREICKIVPQKILTVLNIIYLYRPGIKFIS